MTGSSLFSYKTIGSHFKLESFDIFQDPKFEPKFACTINEAIGKSLKHFWLNVCTKTNKDE